MRCSIVSTVDTSRRAAAAVELAVLMPLLLFLFLIGVDFARVYYFTVTTVNCARNGALYGSTDTAHAADSSGIQAAALADATNMTPAPNVVSSTGADATGNPFVQVTVTTQFQTVINYPGIPASVSVSRTVQMRVAALLPKNS